MLNLTRTRPAFFIFNNKVKTKLPSHPRTEREAARCLSCAAAPHRCLARPGVIVQLEFTSSPRGGDDSLSQPFRKWGTKNYIFKNVFPHIYGFLNGNSFLAILEWIWKSPVLHKPPQMWDFAPGTINHSRRRGGSCKHRPITERGRDERPRCWLLQGLNAPDDWSLNLWMWR